MPAKQQKNKLNSNKYNIKYNSKNTTSAIVFINRI